MITPEILTYIKTERAKSTPDANIRANLLANGWNASDIDEAIASLSSNVPSPIPESEIRRYRSNRTWATFCILIVLDFILIMLLGGRGLFGISVISIIARILVIYLISYFTAIGSKPQKEAWKGALDSVGRVIGALFLTALIGFGIFFVVCFFALSHSNL